MIFLQLNEINFDYVRRYIDAGERLPAFESLMARGVLNTEGELSYNELEPWIQWYSVYSGLTFSEHKVFRLGDGATASHELFFEKIEELGFTVGAFGPMNARNNLKNPGFFIPDPWTVTQESKDWESRFITKALRQAVNDNASGKMTLPTLVRLGLATLSLMGLVSTLKLIPRAIKAIRSHVGRALFLDYLSCSLFIALVKKRAVDFGTLFLNGGAHCQHHFLHDSSVVKSTVNNPHWYNQSDNDPVLESYKLYDEIIEELRTSIDMPIIVATGLTQIPHKAPVFYYRLADHKKFLEACGVEFKSVHPRMTRDFLIEFASQDKLENAFAILAQLRLRGELLFGEIEIRDKSLFCVLTFSREIRKEDQVNVNETRVDIGQLVTFVAIKNGAHSSRGFVASTIDMSFMPANNCHVMDLSRSVVDHFNAKVVG